MLPLRILTCQDVTLPLQSTYLLVNSGTTGLLINPCYDPDGFCYNYFPCPVALLVVDDPQTSVRTIADVAVQSHLRSGSSYYYGERLLAGLVMS